MKKNISLTLVIAASFLLVSCGPSEEEVQALEEAKKVEIAKVQALEEAKVKALEEAKKVEIAKCVRYNADIVYQESYENLKRVLGGLDKAINQFNRAMGSYNIVNNVANAQPGASEKRLKYIPYLAEMCEDSLLFIYNSEQEIPEKFHEELSGYIKEKKKSTEE